MSAELVSVLTLPEFISSRGKRLPEQADPMRRDVSNESNKDGYSLVQRTGTKHSLMS